jgi:hypothetical protein
MGCLLFGLVAVGSQFVLASRLIGLSIKLTLELQSWSRQASGCRLLSWLLFYCAHEFSSLPYRETHTSTHANTLVPALPPALAADRIRSEL